MASKSSRKIVDDDLANVEFETSEDVEVIPTFDSMGLREDLQPFSKETRKMKNLITRTWELQKTKSTFDI